MLLPVITHKIGTVLGCSPVAATLLAAFLKKDSNQYFESLISDSFHKRIPSDSHFLCKVVSEHSGGGLNTRFNHPPHRASLPAQEVSSSPQSSELRQ